MIQQLEKAISKLSQLSEIEQEAIAQIIMTRIETKAKHLNGGVSLVQMAGTVSEVTLLSESSLAKDWLTEQEDQAWQNL